MGAKLVAEEGSLKGLVLSLEDGDTWVIGRDPDSCQLLIEDPSASRKHLVCKSTAEGILVENLSTTNPVLVNNEEVKKPRLLLNGDAVKIGGGIFRFYAEAAAHLFEDATTGQKPITGQEPEEKPQHTKAQAEEVAAPQKEAVPTEEKVEEAVKEETQKQEESNEEPKVPPEAEHTEVEKPVAENISEAMNPEKLVEEESGKVVEFNQEAAKAPITPLPTPPPTSDEIQTNEEVKHDTIYDEEPTDKSNLAQINFGLLETGRWLLKVIGGPNNGAEFTMLAGNSYVIGTDPYACDIVFHDTSVSRQHARITVDKNDALIIEDLKSRNSTLVDGETLNGKASLKPNSIVALGTSAFVVFDREGEMKTIIAPLIPAVVKSLQSEEAKKVEAAPTPEQLAAAELAAKELAKNEAAQHHTTLGALILIAILTGIFIVVGIGTTTLFRSEPVVKSEAVDSTSILDAALAPIPSVKYSFNKNTGQLLLIGHVLNAQDKNQLLYALQGLKFIKGIDDSGIIIDEYVWREINQVIEKNPQWKGINVISSTPGQFVITGYLHSRSQSESLSDFLTSNFPYPDLLENRVIVDDEVNSNATTILATHGFKNITARLENGEMTLTGGVPKGSDSELKQSLKEIQDIRGVRSIRNQIAQLAPEEDVINITEKYDITGVSSHGSNLSVIINGRILMKGDILDGMQVTSILPNAVLLEKEGIRYRIDFQR